VLRRVVGRNSIVSAKLDASLFYPDRASRLVGVQAALDRVEHALLRAMSEREIMQFQGVPSRYWPGVGK